MVMNTNERVMALIADSASFFFLSIILVVNIVSVDINVDIV